MAISAVLPTMNGEKTLHPFFSRAVNQPQTDGSISSDDVQDASGPEQLYGVQEKSSKIQDNVKTRKSRVSKQTDGKTQKTLQEIVNPQPNNGGSRVLEIPDSHSSEPFTSSPKKKRRRTSELEFVEVEDDRVPDNDGLELNDRDTTPKPASPQVLVPASSPLPTQTLETTAPSVKTPPKKMLKLNAKGTFSSPVSKTPKDAEQPVEVPKKRGRPRKTKEPEPEKHLVVVIKYNIAETLGARIDRILSGAERVESEVKKSTPKKRNTPRKQQPSKPTHPFFTGKPKDQKPPPKQESPRKASAVTPGKLRRQTMSERRSPEKKPNAAAQEYVIGSGLFKDRLMFKHPGAKDPAWPDKEQAHVRGLDDLEFSDLADVLQGVVVSPSKRKRKAARIPFPSEDSLLERLGKTLEPEEEGELRSDGFREPHPSLVLPKKLLISGEEIASRVKQELSATFADPDEDELARSTATRPTTHPAIQRLYDRVPKYFSAFDGGTGENLGWTQKYEPSTTLDVLQPQREMTVLKDWLTSLTVTAVGSSSTRESKVVSKSEAKPKKKRKRKNDEMDDFLVDDDEDIRNMDELSDHEETSLPASNGRKAIRSVVQGVSDGVKLSNAVLLSGPNGCGKTAAAHAVAKDLGFKVFEISPSERRSGKDVIEKVGDMTENHLVKHHGTDTAEVSAAEEPNRIDEAFQRDLASGRQGKMNAFFKPKVKAKNTSPRKKKVAQKQAVVDALQKVIKKPPKEQQQSLILLEEVDILFKEDKDFWNTVFKLIESSKRPVIMTCNDEDLVPLQAMSLHAILRFLPPPTELATDYMLLTAAAEGHLLQRGAVRSLYQSKANDLRASIAELDFWCQMGVGDPRGGLSWIFQRYPPGTDLDKDGRKLRIVSEGTYVAGKALLPDRSLDDKEQLLWAQQEFDIDTHDLLGGDASSWKETLTLRQFERLADVLSAADVYAGRSERDPLDTTQPPLPTKARSHYIEGMALLQTDELIDYSDLTSQLRTATSITAHRAARSICIRDIPSKLSAAITSNPATSEDAPTLTRQDFSCFDAIAVPSENALSAVPGLVQSAFDGPIGLIATDLAPYVRCIVQYDLALAEQRERLSGSTNGQLNKRARTTRAARSALEGGQRASTRRERWLTKDLDVHAVLATAGKDWPRTGLQVLDEGLKDGWETPASSAATEGSG